MQPQDQTAGDVGQAKVQKNDTQKPLGQMALNRQVHAPRSHMVQTSGGGAHCEAGLSL